MAGKFELKTGANGKYHFNLKAGNGQIILTSEAYDSKSAAENGIESVRKNAANDANYERKVSSKGEPYFALKAGNGQQIGRSEMYSTEAAMENGIESVKSTGPDATVAEATA